jgi:hypothetical protein
VAVTDFGTSRTKPEDYLDHLVAFSLCTTDTDDGAGAGPLRPVPLDELDGIMAEVRRAQAALYRSIAAMSRDGKIRCGAYVYFSILAPFADLAGLADDVDWSLPLAQPADWYDFFSAMEGTNTGVDEDGPYYELYEVTR